MIVVVLFSAAVLSSAAALAVHQWRRGSRWRVAIAAFWGAGGWWAGIQGRAANPVEAFYLSGFFFLLSYALSSAIRWIVLKAAPRGRTDGADSRLVQSQGQITAALDREA